MATKANFETIIFNEHLGDDSGDLPAFSTTFVGDQTSIANFNIERTPVEKGYLLIHLWDNEKQTLMVEINGTNVFQGEYIAHQHGSHKASIFLLPVNANIMRQGNNTLQVKRDPNGSDNFHIYTVIVNWKEEFRTGLFARFFNLKKI